MSRGCDCLTVCTSMPHLISSHPSHPSITNHHCMFAIWFDQPETMAHHRHQASLESIINFSPPPLLSANQRNHASRRFYQIINHFDVTGDARPTRGTYNVPRLIRLTYEYALSEESRDLFLQAFFRALQLRLDDEEDVDLGGNREENIRADMVGFSEYLMDNFYLPRASFSTLPSCPYG